MFDDFFKTAACLKISKRMDEIKKPRIVVSILFYSIASSKHNTREQRNAKKEKPFHKNK